VNVIRSIRKVAPSLSDADLVLAARTGESWARETLLKRHSEWAHRLAFRLLGPHGGARNLLEMAFSQSFAELGNLRDFSGFSRLLTRQVVKLTQQRQKRGRRAFRRERPDFLGFRSQLALLPSEADRAALTRFYEYLEEVPVNARLALLLRDVERMDLHDIASNLSLTKARARRSLLLAERKLRPLGLAARMPSALHGDSDVLPIPLSEFEHAQLHRRVEQLLDGTKERTYWPWALGAVGISAALSVGIVLVRQPAAAAAPPAEQPAAQIALPSVRSVELPDGSRAELSPGAQLRINEADAAQIRLTLISGRADFEIEQGSGKRFVVAVGEAAVAALGQRLSVSIEAEDPETRQLSVEVGTDKGAAELWRRSDSPSILLGAGESWRGRVAQSAER
jgi:RNA polymerase sigma-70 factor (ECF subfamily)